jgi:hypothetical protein
MRSWRRIRGGRGVPLGFEALFWLSPASGVLVLDSVAMLGLSVG